MSEKTIGGRQFPIPVRALLSGLIIVSSLLCVSAQAQGNRIEELLGNGLEIFRFGMPIKEILKLLPPMKNYYLISENSIRPKKVALPEIVGRAPYWGITGPLSNFGELKFMWGFKNEFPIFASNPCFAKDNGSINFIFKSKKLQWIRLEVFDDASCPSHEQLFRAIADFYGARLMTPKFGRLKLTTSGSAYKSIVTSVPEGTSASDIKVGDQLVSINGVSILHLTGYEYSRIFWGAPGSVVSLGLLRDGNQSVTAKLPRRSSEEALLFAEQTSAVCFSGLRMPPLNMVSIRRPTAEAPCNYNFDFDLQ